MTNDPRYDPPVMPAHGPPTVQPPSPTPRRPPDPPKMDPRTFRRKYYVIVCVLLGFPTLLAFAYGGSVLGLFWGFLFVCALGAPAVARKLKQNAQRRW